MTRDADHVYALLYATRTKANELLRVGVSGGVPELLASEATAIVPYGLAVDATNAYFARLPSTGTEVHMAPKSGGSFSLFNSDSSGDTNQGDVAADGTHVYWIGYASIHRAPVAGGPAEQWAETCLAKQLLLDEGTLYWVCGAVTSTSGRIGSKATSRAALDGPTESVPGATDFSLGPVAIDDRSVYWAANFGGLFFKVVPKAGGAVTTMPTPGMRWITAIAVDSTSIYVGACADATCDTGLRLHRARKTDGAWTVMAELPATIQAIVPTNDYVYLSLSSPAGLARISLD